MKNYRAGFSSVVWRFNARRGPSAVFPAVSHPVPNSIPQAGRRPSFLKDASWLYALPVHRDSPTSPWSADGSIFAGMRYDKDRWHLNGLKVSEFRNIQIEPDVNMLTVDVECWYQIICRNLTGKLIEPSRSTLHRTRSLLELPRSSSLR